MANEGRHIQISLTDRLATFTRTGVLSLALCAGLAAGGLGLSGTAEARIDGDPQSGFAQMCKNIQDAYDNAVDAYHDAQTPEELIAARARLNHWSSVWQEYGCNGPYGDIRFREIGPAKTSGLAGSDSVQVNSGSAGPSKLGQGMGRLNRGD